MRQVGVAGAQVPAASQTMISFLAEVERKEKRLRAEGGILHVTHGNEKPMSYFVLSLNNITCRICLKG